MGAYQHPAFATTFRSSRSCQRGIELRHSLSLQVQASVTIDVQSDCDTTMSKQGLHHLR